MHKLYVRGMGSGLGVGGGGHTAMSGILHNDVAKTGTVDRKRGQRQTYGYREKMNETI